MKDNPTCSTNCIKDTIANGSCWCFNQGIHPENDQTPDTWDEPTDPDPEETEKPDDWGEENPLTMPAQEFWMQEANSI